MSGTGLDMVGLVLGGIGRRAKCRNEERDVSGVKFDFPGSKFNRSVRKRTNVCVGFWRARRYSLRTCECLEIVKSAEKYLLLSALSSSPSSAS